MLHVKKVTDRFRVHSGDRPYSCPRCDVSFACISNLRRHRKQVHPTSPPPSDSANGNEVKSGNEDKKPSLQIITSSIADNISSSSVVTMETPSYMASSSNLSADTPVAIAAAMSGTVLTATGALVPANFLPASSIPGLILTSGAPGGGTLIAAPAHLTEQHSHLHPTIIAHNSGDGNATALLTTSLSGGLCSIAQPSASLSSSSTALGIQSDTLVKASSSSTMSFMFPTVLTSTPHGDGLRQTSVTFLTPTGEIDRSCATLATAGPDGGFILNPVGGDTVYLEPLDPRLTLEPGQQFTLTTIPTSHPHGSATIINPHHSAAQLMGHQVHLQSGQATHIAFATNLPTHGQQASQLLTPNSAIFSSNQAALHSGHSSATVIFPPPASVPHSSLTSQQQSVLQSPTEATAPSQLLHYHRPVCTTGVLPGRPSSTPTQQQTAMLVPIVHTPPVSGTSSQSISTSEANDSINSNPVTSTWPPVSGTFLTFASSHLCPVSSSAVLEDHTDSCNLANSRPSSVLSNSSSLGAITAVSVPETSL